MTTVPNYKMGLAGLLLGRQFGFAEDHSKHSPDGLAYAIRCDQPVVATAPIHAQFPLVGIVTLFRATSPLVGPPFWPSVLGVVLDSQYVARWYLIS